MAERDLTECANELYKLSCRRETARRFVSLNISESLEVTRKCHTGVGRICKSLSAFHRNYVYHTISGILSMKYWRDLKIGHCGHQDVENGAVQ